MSLIKLIRRGKWDCLIGMDYLWPDEYNLQDFTNFQINQNVSRDIRIKAGDRRINFLDILLLLSGNENVKTIRDVNSRDFRISLRELPFILPTVGQVCMSAWHKTKRTTDIEMMFPSQGKVLFVYIGTNYNSLMIATLVTRPSIRLDTYLPSLFGFYNLLMQEIVANSSDVRFEDPDNLPTVDLTGIDSVHILIPNAITMGSELPCMDLVKQIFQRLHCNIKTLVIYGGNDVILDAIVPFMDPLRNLSAMYYLGEIINVVGWKMIASVVEQFRVKNLILSQRTGMKDDGTDLEHHHNVISAASFIFTPTVNKFWEALASENLRMSEEFQEELCMTKNVNREVLLQLIGNSRRFIRDNYFKLTGVVKRSIECEREKPGSKTLADLPKEILSLITSFLSLDDIEIEEK